MNNWLRDLLHWDEKQERRSDEPRRAMRPHRRFESRPEIGQGWYDPARNRMCVWNGSEWVIRPMD